MACRGQGARWGQAQGAPLGQVPPLDTWAFPALSSAAGLLVYARPGQNPASLGCPLPQHSEGARKLGGKPLTLAGGSWDSRGVPKGDSPGARFLQEDLSSISSRLEFWSKTGYCLSRPPQPGPSALPCPSCWAWWGRTSCEGPQSAWLVAAADKPHFPVPSWGAHAWVSLPGQWLLLCLHPFWLTECMSQGARAPQDPRPTGGASRRRLLGTLGGQRWAGQTPQRKGQGPAGTTQRCQGGLGPAQGTLGAEMLLLWGPAPCAGLSAEEARLLESPAPPASGKQEPATAHLHLRQVWAAHPLGPVGCCGLRRWLARCSTCAGRASIHRVSPTSPPSRDTSPEPARSLLAAGREMEAPRGPLPALGPAAAWFALRGGMALVESVYVLYRWVDLPRAPRGIPPRLPTRPSPPSG